MESLQNGPFFYIVGKSAQNGGVVYSARVRTEFTRGEKPKSKIESTKQKTKCALC
jgi:hypothetical protein